MSVKADPMVIDSPAEETGASTPKKGRPRGSNERTRVDEAYLQILSLITD